MACHAVNGADKISAIHDGDPTVLDYKGITLVRIVGYPSQIVMVYTHGCREDTLDICVHVLASIAYDSLPAGLTNLELWEV